jgi:eukaryotic-like serine/threonine-protein kinase
MEFNPSGSDIIKYKRGKSEKMKTLITLFLNLLCVAAFSISPAKEMVGKVWRANLARTGEFPSAGPVQQPKVKWKFKTGGKVLSSPIVTNGKVYIGSNDKYIYCLDEKTGKDIWKYHVGRPVNEAGAVYDGKVFFATKAGLIALDANTGKKLWEQKQTNRELAPLVIPGPIKTKNGILKGLVFSSMPWKALIGYDINTGKEVWRCRDNNGSGKNSSPALHRGTLFYTNGSQGIRMVDLLTERQQGFCDQGIDSYHFTPASRDGKVVSLGEKGIFMFDAVKFQKKYRIKKGFTKPGWDYRHPHFSSPAIDAESIYIGNVNGVMYSINKNSLDQQWEFKTGGSALSSPAIDSKGHIYFGSKDGNIYGLKASTGKQIWKFKTNGPVISSPAIENGILYIGSEDGYVYALK